MKSLKAFTQLVLLDLGDLCGVSTIRDIKTISDRFESEGLSFLTITLPSFCVDLQKGLAAGRVTDDMFLGFKKHAGLPRFLGGFLRLIFETGTGNLLEEPNIHAIYAVRQLSLLLGKIDIACSPARERKAIRGYFQTEQDVRASDESLLSEPDRFEQFTRIGRLLFADFFSEIDSAIYNDSVVPKHGPGATADQLRGNAKYNLRTWTSRLESIFPHWEHVIPNESFLQRTDGLDILEPGNEIAVKVIFVPKTPKTRRIIAEEPAHMQYMQQGILSVMVQKMPRFDNTRHFLMFESQEPNQRLAKEGSFSGTLATLDLSEASDRVSAQHVRALLANHRFLREAVDATRSRKAEIPNENGKSKKTIRLAKFASMGSALCFPMESLVFCTIIFLGIENHLRKVRLQKGYQLTKNDVKRHFGRVRIYGDDLIIPTEYTPSVLEELEAFGLRVNRDKSFWTGLFRESCGKDYYSYHDVSVVRVRHLLPQDRQCVEELVSAVSLRNKLFHKGCFPRSVSYLDDLIRKIIPFPTVRWERDSFGEIIQRSPLLGRHEYWCQPDDHDKRLHIPLVRGAKVTSITPKSKLDDYGALMKWFLHKERSHEPIFSKDHLQRAGRPRSASIKIGLGPM